MVNVATLTLSITAFGLYLSAHQTFNPNGSMLPAVYGGLFGYIIAPSLQIIGVRMLSLTGIATVLVPCFLWRLFYPDIFFIIQPIGVIGLTCLVAGMFPTLCAVFGIVLAEVMVFKYRSFL